MCARRDRLQQCGEARHVPREAQDGDDAHGDGEAQGLALGVSQCAAARRALPLAQVLVRPGRVQAELEAVERRQIPGLRGGVGGGLRVVDDQRVLRDEQRAGHDAFRVLLRVPGERRRGVERHVLG